MGTTFRLNLFASGLQEAGSIHGKTGHRFPTQRPLFNLDGLSVAPCQASCNPIQVPMSQILYCNVRYVPSTRFTHVAVFGRPIRSGELQSSIVTVDSDATASITGSVFIHDGFLLRKNPVTVIFGPLPVAPSVGISVVHPAFRREAQVNRDRLYFFGRRGVFVPHTCFHSGMANVAAHPELRQRLRG